jgi:hypothetical protein
MNTNKPSDILGYLWYGWLAWLLISAIYEAFS